MKKFLIPILVVSVLVSCGGESELGAKPQTGKVVSKVDANEELPEDVKKELAETQRKIREEEKKLEDTLTTLSFDKLKHDFGDVQPETDVLTEFTVTNTGNKPLIIEHVSASCGCTTPQKPEQPIAPGASDIIKVKFKSKPGQMNEITKTVTVTANTKEKTHKLEIRAFVKG